MSDVVDRDSETFQRANAQQRQISRFAKDHFVRRFEPLRSENGVANVACNGLTGGYERPLLSREYARFSQHVTREPGQLGTGVDQSFKRWRLLTLVFVIARNHKDSEQTHPVQCIALLGYSDRKACTGSSEAARRAGR